MHDSLNRLASTFDFFDFQAVQPPLQSTAASLHVVLENPS